MRVTIATILLFVSCIVSGQRIPLSRIDTITTVKDYEVEHIRECLWRYQKQHTFSYMLTTVGAGVVLMNYNMTDNTKSLRYSNIVGGSLIAVGGLIFVDSEKWLRKASISPIPGGIAIGIGKK